MAKIEQRHRRAAEKWMNSTSVSEDSEAYFGEGLGDEAEFAYAQGLADAEERERERVMDLFLKMGEELGENGKAVAEFEPAEGRLRVLASLVMLDVGQWLFTDLRRDEFDRRLNAIVEKFPDHIRDEIKRELAAMNEENDHAD